MNYTCKTKLELIELLKDKDEKIEQLEDDIDYWQTENDDLEEEIDKLNEQLDEQIGDEGIKDLENFIWRLKIDGVYTDELQDFIDNYMNFYNK